MIGSPIVALTGIELTYPGPPPVLALKACDFTVEPGEFVAITGVSGSGKSTLLNVLGLLDLPTGGTYLLDGIDVAELSDTECTALRARKIGFVFQSFHLIDHRTATENVALGLLYSQVPRQRRRDVARAALERVGLGHRLDAAPATLSGGERQRVAIARALAGEPSVLLCDEPTGNLDNATTGAVLELLATLHIQGTTIVLITHEETVAAQAQRVMCMSDGYLSEVSVKGVLAGQTGGP